MQSPVGQASEAHFHRFAMAVELCRIAHLNLQRLGILKHHHAVDLAARQQKRADTVYLGGLVCKRFRVGADGLNMCQFAISVDAIDKG